ncbi:MAG: hypothetical protein J6T54_08450, partial [Fibrobacter sp.]|nr:hypothetical protein [Fibrobacter sp.]
MRIDKIKDVRTRHIQRYMANPELQEPECMQMEHNWAVYGPMRFVSMNDAFVVTDEILKEWGYRGHASRQLKAVFKKEHLEQILSYLDSKDDMIDEYIATVDEYKEALEEE